MFLGLTEVFVDMNLLILAVSNQIFSLEVQEERIARQEVQTGIKDLKFSEVV